ncbi:MAG: hypothetical protein IPI84_01565 [Holophagaceae bacterium]|nr:hypothetical protein [Holophagaceae bacterium]
MFHDKPMRFLPLIPSSFDPAPWLALAPVMLQWDGHLAAGWPAAVARGLAVHAVFLPGEVPAEEGLAVLRQGLGPDFLVIPVAPPASREAGFRLLGQLETLLEATTGRGVKLALHIAPGAEPVVLDLLRQAHGEAVGFCWHPGIQDVELLADRLWCGVCEATSDLKPLQRLGYRWDMALPATDSPAFQTQAAALEAAHPAVLFPAEMPTTALGRPVVPDDSLTFGAHWQPQGPRS